MVKLHLVHKDHVPVSMVDRLLLTTPADLTTEKGLKDLQRHARLLWTRTYRTAKKAEEARNASTS